MTFAAMRKQEDWTFDGDRITTFPSTSLQQDSVLGIPITKVALLAAMVSSVSLGAPRIICTSHSDPSLRLTVYIQDALGGQGSRFEIHHYEELVRTGLLRDGYSPTMSGYTHYNFTGYEQGWEINVSCEAINHGEQYYDCAGHPPVLVPAEAVRGGNQVSFEGDYCTLEVRVRSSRTTRIP